MANDFFLWFSQQEGLGSDEMTCPRLSSKGMMFAKVTLSCGEVSTALSSNI